MIWESCYWKQELYRFAQDLLRRRGQRRWPPASSAKVERTIMVGFYMVRKLLDASKLSDEVRDKVVPLLEHPATGKPVTYMNWHRLDELYDFSTSASVQRPLRFICNQMVHSYVFAAVVGEEGGLEGLLFVSDYQRQRRLFFIALDDIIDVFSLVAYDDPTRCVTTWNPETGDYDISLTSIEMPVEEDVP